VLSQTNFSKVLNFGKVHNQAVIIIVNLQNKVDRTIAKVVYIKTIKRKLIKVVRLVYADFFHFQFSIDPSKQIKFAIEAIGFTSIIMIIWRLFSWLQFWTTICFNEV